jgi:hypothetical protein
MSRSSRKLAVFADDWTLRHEETHRMATNGSRYNRAVVYYFWGRRYLEEATKSARTVLEWMDVPTVAITDCGTAGYVPSDSPFSRVDVVTIRERSMLGKATLYDVLPMDYDSFLYLDTDTQVLGDLSYGFEKAEAFGLAAVMEPFYSLDHFRGFDAVLSNVGLASTSQLQYNAGVLFFVRRADVEAVMRRWRELTFHLGPKLNLGADQPFLTLAMELLAFNPFTLSPSYNYRAKGEGLTGVVRIWHSNSAVPPAINRFTRAWPARRYWGRRLIMDGNVFTRVWAALHRAR